MVRREAVGFLRAVKIMNSKKFRRTMKENLLDEEVYQIRKMRGQIDPFEEFRRQRALDIISSDDWTSAILARRNNENLKEKAERVASKAHQFQFRKDFVTPAICHPRNVVSYLKEIGINKKDILCSAWLHDTIEDSYLELSYIEKEFGPNVARIVQKLTKDGDREKYKYVIKNSDYDVQIIKLADTLDNCSHLDDPCLPRDLAERKINDCRSLYLPMAQRICPRFYSMLLERIEGFSKKDYRCDKNVVPQIQ